MISNYQNRRRLILDNWSRQLRNYRENFRALPGVTKLLIVSSVLLLIAFLGSIIYLRANQNHINQNRANQETLRLINSKKETAEENILIYHNDSAALDEIQAAKDLLGQLRCKTAEEKVTCNNLKEQLENILVKIEKITVVAPELIADWSSPPISLAASKIIKISDKILGFNSATSTLIIYDPLTKSSRLLPIFGSGAGYSAAAVPKENDYVILLKNGRELLQFNLQNNLLKKIEVSFPTDKALSAAMVVYNRRLYSLDPTQNQIYKHDSTKEGFGPGRDWIIDNGVNLTSGVSLALDGDAFVLSKNGQIIKLTKGASSSFSLQGLNPPLTSGDKIWTYNDLNYLYVLDGENKRLIILEKDGRLKAQLTAKEFSRPTDLVIDDGGRTAYLVDQAKLYKISLPL